LKKKNSYALSPSNYEFVKLLIRLIGGGLAPSSQTVGSLVIALGQKSDELKNLANLGIAIIRVGHVKKDRIDSFDWIVEIIAGGSATLMGRPEDCVELLTDHSKLECLSLTL